MKKWKCSSLDVKSAFLQSHHLDRIVYLNPPRDIRKKNIVWKIMKPIYGLKDSAKNWYCSLKTELIALGCVESILDPTVYCFYEIPVSCPEIKDNLGNNCLDIMAWNLGQNELDIYNP